MFDGTELSLESPTPRRLPLGLTSTGEGDRFRQNTLVRGGGIGAGVPRAIEKHHHVLRAQGKPGAPCLAAAWWWCTWWSCLPWRTGFAVLMEGRRSRREKS